MPGLGTVPFGRFEKFLLHIGCVFDRQKGDHRIYKRADLKRPLVVPFKNPLPAFIVRNNLRTLGMTTGQFLDILKRT